MSVLYVSILNVEKPWPSFEVEFFPYAWEYVCY
jgi:hypothetical protein